MEATGIGFRLRCNGSSTRSASSSRRGKPVFDLDRL